MCINLIQFVQIFGDAVEDPWKKKPYVFAGLKGPIGHGGLSPRHLRGW